MYISYQYRGTHSKNELVLPVHRSLIFFSTFSIFAGFSIISGLYISLPAAPRKFISICYIAIKMMAVYCNKKDGFLLIILHTYMYTYERKDNTWKCFLFIESRWIYRFNELLWLLWAFLNPKNFTYMGQNYWNWTEVEVSNEPIIDGKRNTHN